MAEDDLPDPLAPGGHPDHAGTPRGDLTVASILALASGGIVLGWYLVIFAAGGALVHLLFSPGQIAVWVLAVVAIVTGILCLNARMRRGLAAAGFIVGVAAILVALTIGLGSEYRIVL